MEPVKAASDFLPFINMGMGGVALYMLYKILTNHIEHNTKAIEELRDAVSELIIWLKSDRR